MEASSTVVIKVKYGDMLRRFNAQIVGEQLSFRMDGLREKILNLFSFNPDTELVLTYIDEDDDVVTLVDDDDLSDVVKQGLDPLRVTVKVKGANTGKHDTRSSASASLTPVRSPRVPQPLENLNIGVEEILKSVPEPLRDTLTKLSADLASKASSSAPSITELVDQFSKVGLSFLGQLTESSQPGVKTAATETNGSEVLKVDSDGAVKDATNEATLKNNEVKIQNVPGESMEGSSSGFIKVVQPGNDFLPNFPQASTQNVKCVGKKENFKKSISMRRAHLTSQLPPPSANNAGKEMSNPSEPKIGPKPATVGASPWTPFPGLNTTDPFFGGMPPVYDCPFSGAPFGNMPPPPANSSSTVRRSSSQNDGIGNVFHRGVRCDGCGVHPITGPRFKSKVKVDYDLCCICFEEMGNHSDYIRMDRPAVYRHHMPFKGLHDSRANDWNSTSPQVYKGCKVKPSAVKLDSRFILDVNIFDGTVMAPLSPFTKIWRMRNNGSTVWPQKTQLVWIGGDKLSNEISVEVQIPEAGLMMDQEIDVAVDFIAPELPGRYVSYWRMSSPSGQKFGQRVWVLIQVDTSLAETPRGSVRNLNLNLPPTGPEMINVNPEPTIEDNHPENETSKKIVELVQPNTEQDLKFPINDSLFVGNGASTSTPSSSSSPPPPTVSYPIIDLSDVAPRLPSVPSPMFYPPPPAPPAGAQQAEENEVEKKLLRELEEMGFKEVDLNIEVLRMHEYDLEQAVDDLCGVAEWDPILEELQEMGFGDTVMNKMLLKKNNGSIKRVVMDLIAGENN